MVDRQYDIVIIGGGPAGFTAAIYAARARRSTIVLEKAMPGGQIATTDMVENYPGFPDGISGFELGQRMMTQAAKYGAETAFAEVLGVDFSSEGLKAVRIAEGDYYGRAIIICSGASHEKLGVPGEEEFVGRGVSNCAVCDAAFFKDQVVAVVGGGDAALDEGLYLSRYASKVQVIHRRAELRAEKILQERAFANPKMEFIWDTVVEAIVGNDQVHGVELHNLKTRKRSLLPVSGVFVYIGLRPNTDYLKGALKLLPSGHIQVSDMMETEVPGVFAAGDVRQNAARQAISAAGDGATAAIFADKYLSEHGG